MDPKSKLTLNSPTISSPLPPNQLLSPRSHYNTQTLKFQLKTSFKTKFQISSLPRPIKALRIKSADIVLPQQSRQYL